MLEESIKRFSMAFEEQFHYGCFYAYLKIKEQEIKNVTWLADLITMQADRGLPGWNKVIVPFMYHVNDEKEIQWVNASNWHPVRVEVNIKPQTNYYSISPQANQTAAFQRKLIRGE